jgi:hypothetical protein
VRALIQPLIELFRDAIQLGKDRKKLDPAAFGEAYRRLIERFDDLMLRTRSQHPDCVRIWDRLADTDYTGCLDTVGWGFTIRPAHRIPSISTAKTPWGDVKGRSLPLRIRFG